MDYSNTNLDFLQHDLETVFGTEKGAALYDSACKKYTELCATKEKSSNNVMNSHIFGKIFPAIALYKSLLENGFTQTEAFDQTLEETQHNARRLKEANKAIGKMPFAYTMFKLFVKAHMKKNYPSEGWNIEWKQCDKTEIHFDMTRCIYNNLCHEYGCPELCTVFCRNDDTAFEGYLPQIGFNRDGTLGQGAVCCDFHYINVKRIQQNR